MEVNHVFDESHLKPQREIFRKKWNKRGNAKLNLSPQVASSSGFWILPLKPSFCKFQQSSRIQFQISKEYIPNLLTSKSLEKLPLKLKTHEVFWFHHKTRPSNPQTQQKWLIGGWAWSVWQSLFIFRESNSEKIQTTKRPAPKSTIFNHPLPHQTSPIPTPTTKKAQKKTRQHPSTLQLKGSQAIPFL